MPHAVDHHAILARFAPSRGGDGNIFRDIDPSRLAHIVVDMQNGFMEEGAPVEVPVARTIVDNINRISAAVRDAGGHNVFLRYTTPPEGGPSWSNFMVRMGREAQGHREAFTPGAHHWQLWPTLDVREADAIVDKHRFSGFTPGTCALKDVLDARGIDTVLITGTLTNCCCESTARDAMQHNYRVLMASDANAALSDEEHAATLHIMAMVFADLHSTQEVVDLLGS
ncbi:isochorismatase hydrolase [Novosphingobium aromaticivorans DSM 12444]|uniref:Isochorismatase hydrolase n=1 Tax=Novosphingobium aromaticivorans (strain ATCC 700278 / DSM 12444 / CCUG 56034 / CIP 105152 / NBRC 16084 / F199) TaxID=279238 RepID=Q2G6M6_NOVAD|nr:isochorismatase family cysteine hydrolase [Novosphingobium aromaticivorans]ABD26497.1 isochorismatase hydrolase [Novosphingobium aromaticivorans DSM 12444]SCY76830.1 ureidoacrylate peracid hydrolase [Novosphingobium aromaticivorans]